MLTLDQLKQNLSEIFSQSATYESPGFDQPLPEIAQKLSASPYDFFFFESLLDEGCYGNFSVLGFDPEISFMALENTLYVKIKNAKWQPIHLPDNLNPYQALQTICPQNLLARQYAGGLVGYLAYDAMRFMEAALQDLKLHSEFPSFEFGLYQDGLIYNQLTGQSQYFYYQENRLDTLKALLEKEFVEDSPQVLFKGDELDQFAHSQKVLAIKEKIQQGYLFQCEVGFKSHYEIKGNPFAIYQKLREVNPSPNMFYVKQADRTLLGASPELLFRLQEGLMETFPLAGTVSRGKDNAEDMALANQLRQDPKEIAEHNMLVDLHRNDIGRVARFDTVRVRKLMDIKRFSHVQHLSSEIIGFIDPIYDMFSALAANFPAGTLSGAPKIEAMKTINHNEASGRGPYGGAVGHFGVNGDCTFAIPIRSLFIAGDQGYIQTSGGIVADSEPELEYLEIQRKLAAMKKVLEIFIQEERS